MPHPVPAGLDVLVTLFSIPVSALVCWLVARHAHERAIPHPVGWAVAVGAPFALLPILLVQPLVDVYAVLFVSHGTGTSLVVRPLHALVTVLGGGWLAASAGLAVYALHLRNGPRAGGRGRHGRSQKRDGAKPTTETPATDRW
ncbi:hypothetical protein [Haloarchaeobius sp. DFWS5]|uniref:hypothetical protein n=1 Tax=Haloarchaeobius sp. DFWS5 TaxID=3446114 RepID=UPI003EB81050